VNALGPAGNLLSGARIHSFVIRRRYLLSLLALGLAFAASLAAQTGAGRQPAPTGEGVRGYPWALILDEAPLADRVATRSELYTPLMERERQRLRAAQTRMRGIVAARQPAARVIGGVQVLANAVFVHATPEEAADLGTLPGVRAVRPMQPLYRAGNRALDLVNAPRAWNFVGGKDKAGEGVFVGIIDTGIDQNHPAFQDESLREVPRRCVERFGECAFTNRKVIAARSYVDMLAASDIVEFTRPDDLSPRDRQGHGTAVAMLAAGAEHDSPLGRISGVAPKAYVGNYKVFGSPGVNDITFTNVIVTAMEDALFDGMDVITLSLQAPAAFGPLDTAPEVDCGVPNGQWCDLRTEAVQRLTRLGLAVVAAAGNDGDLGIYLPGLGSITSPGTAPAAITAGASSNAHRLTQSLRIAGEGVPEPLRQVRGLFGNGPRPREPLAAPLVDIRTLEDDGKACSPLPHRSLAGSVALVEARGCTTRVKVQNAARAGARAVVLFRAEGLNTLIQPDGLLHTPIPLMLITNQDGLAIRQFLEANRGREAVLDPGVLETDEASEADIVPDFSSRGPAIGTYGIKPDLVAPGTDLLVATQSFDPAADLYDPSGFTVVNGTSFSTGLVAGGVALARQTLPGLQSRPENEWAPILKSSVVNTADPRVFELDARGRAVDASVVSMGSGKLDIFVAAKSPIAANPATIGFGVLNRATFPVTRSVVFTNLLDRQIRINLRIENWTEDRLARLELGANNITLAPNGVSQPLAVRLVGSRPQPGIYEGLIIAEVEGDDSPFQIPYLYLVGDGVPFNILPVRNQNFSGLANNQLQGGLLCKIVDRFGVPVANLPVQWRVLYGGGQLVRLYPSNADPRTDIHGVAEATVVDLGPQLGEQAFEVEIRDFPGLGPYQFVGNARLQPMIESGGVVNAATGRRDGGLAPGSIISIYGRGLSEFQLRAAGPGLPLSLGGISVSFDEPSRRISLPGRLLSVADDRVDVQVPWELQGVPSVLTKVSIDAIYSSVAVNVPLSAVSPAFWTTEDPVTGQVFVDARDEDGNRIDSANRARRGQLIRLYANGLGAVSGAPVTGEPAPEGQPQPTARPVSVRIGDRTVEPEFAGLAVGRTGINEVRLRLPGDVSGTAEITVTVDGISSPAARLPIEN
jgi:uncharacterized protein (TIGR03437 family)